MASIFKGMLVTWVHVGERGISLVRIGMAIWHWLEKFGLVSDLGQGVTPIGMNYNMSA